ncbi:MAG: GNAT family N-acetyltransferase [Acidisphaera sp.]|nr:GNAT family N-acetyltransferase [Acidisphaera sp.]
MIRVVGPAHAPALAAVHAEAFAPAEAWDAASLAAQLRLPGGYGLLAEAGGMALAQAAAEQSDLLTIAVIPAARRAGLGAALLRAAMQEAARRGAAAMFLEVAETNTPARALYAAAGFVPVGRRRDYYTDGGDALVLRAGLIPCGSAGG